MSLSFTSLRVSDLGSIIPVLPQPVAWHTLPGRIKVDRVGRGIAPTAWFSSAFFCSYEGGRVDGCPSQGKWWVWCGRGSLGRAESISPVRWWSGDGPQGSGFEERMRKVQVRGRIKKGESRSTRKRMAPSVT